ncbi:MAG: Gfo/Idh/MocA family oxidoreductase [Planctomycetes bacterium]|nr:Gfo/Idh/MocA family oxidoreductase [Planctomycetota bacterium]
MSIDFLDHQGDDMEPNTRREFLQQAGLGAAVWAAGATTGQTNAQAAAGDPLTLAVIGPGGMGMNHTRLLSSRKDVRIAYVCDVDTTRLEAAGKEVATRSGTAPQLVRDMRQVFDDKSVDAVFIATPDHWHAPAAILALDAGKHVYVEKPCCHNIREGRAMVEAVRRSGKLLQVGTQSRSTAVVREAIERVRAGEIGEVLIAKAWNSQLRRAIGKTQPTAPPPQLDFDTWLGPAQPVPYRTNLLHGVWRWWYDFGCGDIGNDGVHDIDVAAWGLGVDTHPSTISCLGGKYFFDDDQQFPDTQYAVFEYPIAGRNAKKQFIFEQRIWSPYVQEGYENGAALYGTNGMLIIGHTVGWKLYGPRNKLIAEKTGEADLPAHHQNFFDCIRGTQQQLNASIQVGFLSASLVHLANIAARVGRVLKFDPQREQILDDDAANQLLGRKYREGHWAIPRTT